MRSSPSIFSRPIILIILFILIIGVVYSPVVYFSYLFHDDANFWIKLKEYGFRYYYFDKVISQGRYTFAYLLVFENFFVHKVSDLRFLRFLGIVISGCNAYLLLQQMRRLSFSDIQAFLIISAMFFLPGFADIFFNSSYSSLIPICIYLACWSFYRIDTGKGLTLPILSFLLAITIYQPTAMFYWVMVGMYILFAPDRHDVLFKKNIFRSISVGLIGLLIYATLIFLMHYFFLHKINSPLYNPYEINRHLFSKIQWFFQEPLGNALNLWNIFPKKAVSNFVLGFILITALIAVIKRKGTAFTYLWQSGLFIFVFFLTFLPNLTAKENAAFYRCLVPLTSLTWLVLVWAIFQWKDIIPAILTKWSLIALLSTLVVYAGIKTDHNVLCYRVLPSYVEWNMYKTMAEEINSKKADAIYVSIPYHLSIERYDEFGILSSNYIFDIYHIIYSALKETGKPAQHPIPLLYVSYPGDHVLTELKEIYIQKLPDGKWVGRDINRGSQLHAIDHSAFGDTLDRELICSQSPHKIPSQRQNWYVLNLNDLFNASNYTDLIKGF